MQTNKFRIAIDAMGGDYSPISEIEGAYLAINDPQHQDIDIFLVGDEFVLNKKINELGYDKNKLTVVHAPQQVTMHDDPTDVIKKKKQSSLYIGAEIHKNGIVQAFASAGNTGAMLAVSTMILGRIKGVSRPTIGSFFPSIGKNPVFVLDVGATVDLKPRYLYEYAVMGSIFVEEMLSIPNPKVGLLNVGEEESKGTELVKETYKLLKESKVNFIGNVEGRDIFAATSDIVICDGFVGNIVLKFAESFLTLLKFKVKEFSEQGMVNKIKTALMVPTLKEILLQFDYQTYGGVPMLGVDGVSIIGHGKSSPLAIKNMIIRAKDMIIAEINNKIETALIN